MSQYFAGSTNANLTQAGVGRKRGSLNKTHAIVRWGLTEAYRQLGGVDGLVRWGQKHPTEFYQLLGKLIPAEIADQHGHGGGRIQVVILPAGQAVIAQDKRVEQAEQQAVEQAEPNEAKLL